METLRFLMVSSHFPPYHLGGDAIFVKYLSEELVRRGHEVNVMYSPSVYMVLRGKHPSTKIVNDEHGLRRHEYRSRYGRLGPIFTLSAGWSHGAQRAFRSLAKDLKPDVVHWHNTKGFIGCPIRVDGAVNLYTAHDFYFVCPRSNLLRPGAVVCERARFCQLCLVRWKKPPQLWRTMSRRVIRPPSGTTVISPSHFLATRLADDGIRVDHVLRNFVPDKRMLVSSRRLNSTILYLGVLEVLKGPHILLDAFSRSCDEHQFNLCLMGEGSMRKELMRKISSLGLESRVSLPGFLPLEEMKPILEETAFLVIPTVAYENSPLAVMEAFSMSIPVVGSNLGGLPEILDKDSGSMVFNASDAGSLAECLRYMWHHRDGLANLGTKSRKAYEMRYSPEAHMKEYLALAQKVQ